MFGRPASRLGLFSLIAASLLAAACTSSASDEATADDDIVSSKVDDHWFYSGPIPALEDPALTVSLAGHTAHVSGTLPQGTELPDLPHVKKTNVGSRTRVDIVYPIATAKPGKSNSRPGTYAFHQAKPYRPNGPAFTEAEGWHDVPWGGFPFIAYNGGIALHGPITDKDNEAPGSLDVWYLQRGAVSGGCNRMMGEHVVELTHVLGMNMRKVYEPNKAYRPTTAAKVKVIAGYDEFEGKYIDVDYPTDSGAKRPGTVYGKDKVVMFGSWILTEMPDGKDLPPDMKWQGGESGSWYDFNAHARRDYVCSMPKRELPALKTITARTGELPADFCMKKRACSEERGRACKANELGL